MNELTKLTTYSILLGLSITCLVVNLATGQTILSLIFISLVILDTILVKEYYHKLQNNIK